MPEPTLYPVRLKLPESIFDALSTVAEREYRDLPAQATKFVVEGLERVTVEQRSPSLTLTNEPAPASAPRGEQIKAPEQQVDHVSAG